jgi:hypothetical protein
LSDEEEAIVFWGGGGIKRGYYRPKPPATKFQGARKMVVVLKDISLLALKCCYVDKFHCFYVIIFYY